MNLVSKMLIKQVVTTITNKQLTLIMEAMFATFAAGKYIDEAENLITKISKLKSKMDSTTPHY